MGHAPDALTELPKDMAQERRKNGAPQKRKGLQ